MATQLAMSAARAGDHISASISHSEPPVQYSVSNMALSPNTIVKNVIKDLFPYVLLPVLHHVLLSYIYKCSDL